MAELQDTQRAGTRRPWLVIGSIIGVVLIAVGILFFKDDAPPDDAWLLPKIQPEPAEKNPLVLFCETVEAHPIDETEYLKLVKAAKEFKNISTDDMSAFVNKHALQSEAFDKLLETDPTKWRWPNLTGDADFRTSFNYLTGCNAIVGRLQRMKSELLVRDGKAEEATNEALKTIRYGHGITVPEGYLITWLVGITCQRIGETDLRSALKLRGIGEDTLRRAQEVMTSLDLEFGHIRQILTWEYLGFKNTIARVKSGDIPLKDLFGNASARTEFFVRKNRTYANYLALFRPVNEAAQKDWPTLLNSVCEQQRIIKEWRERWFSFHINPNAGGNLLVEMSTSVSSKVYEKGAATSALHRQAVIMIALRRYELAVGKLPEKLDALAPKYLPAVPLDPFDNMPMRWDSATGALYSVGADFKDDHGGFSDPYKSSDKDVGRRYWWKPKESK